MHREWRVLRTQVSRNVAIQTAAVGTIESRVNRDERRHVVVRQPDLRRGDAANSRMLKSSRPLVTGVQEVLGVVVTVNLRGH